MQAVDIGTTERTISLSGVLDAPGNLSSSCSTPEAAAYFVLRPEPVEMQVSIDVCGSTDLNIHVGVLDVDGELHMAAHTHLNLNLKPTCVCDILCVHEYVCVCAQTFCNMCR